MSETVTGRGCAEIIKAFELLSEQEVDLLQPTYQRFFQLCPEAEQLMGHSDEHMRGRMLDQTLELLMDDQLQGPESYFRWEINNHVSAYGVSPKMYTDYFEALGEAVKHSLGAAWSSRFEKGWRLRTAELLRDVAST